MHKHDIVWLRFINYLTIKSGEGQNFTLIYAANKQTKTKTNKEPSKAVKIYANNNKTTTNL